MSTNPEGITNPPIGNLLKKVDSRYQPAISATRRARQINTYYSQLGEELLEDVNPLVSVAPQEKPPSTALYELQGDLLQYTQIDPEAEAAGRVATETDPALTFVDLFAELDTNFPS